MHAPFAAGDTMTRQGAVATKLPGELPALLQEVAAGHSVVVLQNLGLDFAPRWHYAVLVGYDRLKREFVLRSGEEERQTLSWATFEHTWTRAGQWAGNTAPSASSVKVALRSISSQ